VTQARRRLRGASRPMTRDVRLSALHRGGCWPRARLGEAFGRCTAGRCPEPHIGEFTRPARSGGRAGFPGSLPGAWLRATPAGRRIPLRLKLVSGDALGERDAATVAWKCVQSRSAPADLFTSCGQRSASATLNAREMPDRRRYPSRRAMSTELLGMWTTKAACSPP
jgi:hypothetical protein